MSSTDRIEKKLFLGAPRSRVWEALRDSRKFGAWFRAEFDAPFLVGTAVRARILHPGMEHLTFEIVIDALEPERRFAFRWHPYAIDPKVDYAKEPMTTVEFTLEDAVGGTKVTLVESGFDAIPEGRRAEAFRMNEGGWTAQATNLERYVTRE